MAKKAKAEETVEVAPQPVVAKKAAPQKPVKPSWEFKDRLYTLTGNKRPLVYSLQSKNNRNKPLMWFDPKLGYQREIRYATNQNSIFVDEQKGTAILGRIIFRDGALRVPKEQVALQKLLSLYHPGNGNVYEEYKPVEQSVDDLAYMDLEIEALLSAKQMGIEQIEAILRVEAGEKVDTLSSSELKRDILIFAKRNPVLFLELANDDNVELRNNGIKAVQQGILILSADQRTFSEGNSKRKLLTVPFDEHPYSALASWFKTDEGMEVYKHIIKKL